MSRQQFQRRSAALALATTVTLAALPALAVIDTEHGTVGANGSNGQVVNNGGLIEVTAGQAGGAGGPANADAESTDDFNEGDAYGGAGGNGGNGVSAGAASSAGGNGGAGGAAIATSRTTYVGGNPSNSYASATGGSGGNGGNGGSIRFGPHGAGGVGGNGGNATASGSAENDAGGDVNVSVDVIGGTGGAGGAGAGGAGGNGGVASITGVSIPSFGIPGVLQASVTGGSGGLGMFSASGGNGAAETLNNVFTVYNGNSAIGTSLQQSVTGGNSGGSNGGSPGTAGDATSTVSYTQNGSASFQGFSTAVGGNAGPSYNTAGGAGGNASATTDLTSDAPLELQSAATGGNGNGVNGFADSATLGGNGGNSTASVTAHATGGAGRAGIQAMGISDAGAGGAGATGNGGNGGAAMDTGLVHNTTSDAVVLQVESTGGAGGAANAPGFTGGQGGTADLGITSGSSTGGGNVTVTGTITGGSGGAGFNGANGGDGGATDLSAKIFGTTAGALTLTQHAFGGSGGVSYGGGTPGVGGNANCLLDYTDTTSPSFAAEADASGGSGGGADDHDGARGGDSTVTTSIIANKNLTVTANAGAFGSAGGALATTTPGFTAGAGGDATIYATGTSKGTIAGASAVTVRAIADGEDGGSPDTADYPAAVGNGGNGGNAQVTAIAVGAGPDLVYADAEAQGGEGGVGQGAGATNGLSGTSTASASATGAAQAQALASGATASSLARINSTGRFSFLQGTSSGGEFVESSTTLSHVAPSDTYSVSYLIGNPLSGDVTFDWSPDPNVSAAFGNSAANVHALARPFLLNTLPARNSIDINENGAQLTGNNLLIGLLDIAANTNSLPAGDALRFRIVRAGTTLIDRTFSSAADAKSYFTDTVLNLGVTNAGLNGANLDLQCLVDLTGPNAAVGPLTFHLMAGISTSGIGNDTWNNAAGGSWGMPTNWTNNTLPDGPGVHVLFGNAIASAQTVTLDENTTVGSINFNNAAAYTIAPGGAGGYGLTMDNAGAQAFIVSSIGSHVISAPITIASPGLTINASGPDLALTGGITGPGPVTTSGGGTITAGAMTVNGLNVQVGRLQFVAGSAAPARSVGALSIASSGLLDIADGKLVTSNPAGTWNGSSYTGVAGLVQSGRNGGAWNGATGMTSSLASTGGSNLYALGVAKAGDIEGIADSATTTFAGQIVYGSDTIVMYTYGGDANLDGKINIDDYGRIDGNVGQSGSVFGWYNGDFNYDGKINIDDYGIIDGNIGQQGAPIPTMASAVVFDGVSAVPEPITFGLIAMIGVGMLSRRKRSK